MPPNEEKRFNLPCEIQYKHGAVTFIVTAHFNANGEDIVPKIKRLLRQEIQSVVIPQKSGLSPKDAV